VVNQEFKIDRDYLYLYVDKFKPYFIYRKIRCNRIKRLVRNEYKATTFSFFSLKGPTKKLLIISVGIFRESSGEEISVAKGGLCFFIFFL